MKFNRVLNEAPFKPNPKYAYRSTEMADDYLKNYGKYSAAELRRLFNQATDEDNKIKYGKAYLLRKYGEKYEPYINEILYTVQTLGLDNNEYVSFLEAYRKKFSNKEMVKELIPVYIKAIEADPTIAADSNSFLYDQNTPDFFKEKAGKNAEKR